MIHTIIIGYLSGIELLSETKFEKWNEQITIVLGCVDLTHALREHTPSKLTFKSIKEIKALYEK